MTTEQQNLLAALNKRGYETSFASSKDEALQIILKEVENFKTVGWGGSESVKEIGAKEKLLEAGKEICEYARECDVFLLSANALTSDGRIVNIDGNGNRIAASIYGPKRVIYIIGRNKIVNGGIDEAIVRIKKFACPPNARRLGRNTPCALTGVCADCSSPERMCKIITFFERCPTRTPTKVIIVDEELGY